MLRFIVLNRQSLKKKGKNPLSIPILFSSGQPASRVIHPPLRGIIPGRRAPKVANPKLQRF